MYHFNPYPSNIFFYPKCLLSLSATQIQIFTMEVQTLGTQISLLPREQNDLGPYCLRIREQTTSVVNGG